MKSAAGPGVCVDLGCGKNKQPGCFGVDAVLLDGVDVVGDLSRGNIPFRTSSVRGVYCSHFLEHLEDPGALLKEIHRVLVPGGRLFLRVPHYSNYAGFNPAHRSFFGQNFFDIYDPDTDLGKRFDYFSDEKFRIVNKELRLFKTWKLPYTYLLQWLASWKPAAYECHFAFLSPAEEIYVEMEVLK
ncbi:MAG TPA: class I SAM-dependent methyltransferase [Elusimicrobiota bacterium]|nr:class I SAM-dependent methyltransferase [Elusimicrobiota bacterium]